MRPLLAAALFAASSPALAQASDATEAAAPLEPTLLAYLQHLKITGYVQARYSFLDAAEPVSEFSVRRARIKPTFTTEWAQYLIEIDATGDGVTVRDAQATFFEPWTGHRLALTMGQTKWPFGWEISQSSGARELPERAQVTRAFALNERDRGAKLAASLGVFQLDLGVFNGNGITTEGDNDNSKDVVGRLGFDLEWLAGGVSGWWGETLRPAEQGGGFFPRHRLGLDARLTLHPLPVGSTVLRAELIAGRTYFQDRLEQFGVPALGWYAVLVQDFHGHTQLAVRYDFFDGGAGQPDSLDPEGLPSGTNAVGVIGLALIHQLNAHLEASAVYELRVTGVPAGGSDPADNLFTFQLQAKI